MAAMRSVTLMYCGGTASSVDLCLKRKLLRGAAGPSLSLNAVMLDAAGRHGGRVGEWASSIMLQWFGLLYVIFHSHESMLIACALEIPLCNLTAISHTPLAYIVVQSSNLISWVDFQNLKLLPLQSCSGCCSIFFQHNYGNPSWSSTSRTISMRSALPPHEELRQMSSDFFEITSSQSQGFHAAKF